MKRFVIVLLCLLLGTFSYFYQYGYKMEISEAQMQEKINAKLPFSKSYYTLFKATLKDANVEFIQDSVHIHFNASLGTLRSHSLLNKILHRDTTSLISGSVDVSAIPEYHSETGQLFLTQIKVVGMDIKGIHHSKKYEHVVQKLVAYYLTKHLVYTLMKTDSKKFVAKYFLKGINVNDGELQVLFGI